MIIAADLDEGRAASAPSTFPHPDSLESWAAGRALDELGEQRGIGKGPEVVEPRAAGRRTGRSTPSASSASASASGIANVMNLFDPDLIVIGGGVIDAGELLPGPPRRRRAGSRCPASARRRRIRARAPRRARRRTRSGAAGRTGAASDGEDRMSTPRRQRQPAPRGARRRRAPARGSTRSAARSSMSGELRA